MINRSSFLSLDLNLEYFPQENSILACVAWIIKFITDPQNNNRAVMSLKLSTRNPGKILKQIPRIETNSHKLLAFDCKWQITYIWLKPSANVSSSY